MSLDAAAIAKFKVAEGQEAIIERLSFVAS